MINDILLVKISMASLSISWEPCFPEHQRRLRVDIDLPSQSNVNSEY